MGKYTYRGVECFSPDNDENTLYLNNYGDSLVEVRAKIIEHFGVSAEEAETDFAITAEHIHTRCIGLDYHDSGDWDTFIVAKRVQP